MDWSPDTGSLDFRTLGAAYAAGTFRPVDVVRAVYRRIARRSDDAVWILLVPEEEALARARSLPGDPASLPLFGLPFAVKDNIDVAGYPTTAGCPAYAYVPPASATVVRMLEAAGAILVGKTNLDQFATGLVGTRSPYGTPRNPFHPEYIPGGSSSGSAVAVSAGLASFALGTDTAGSGRVPAAFTNTIGLKPTRGLVSAAGVVPACRSLDCVSVFALTVADAHAVLAACARFDPADPYARRRPADVDDEPRDGAFRLGVPAEVDLRGDRACADLFAAAVDRLVAAGGERVPVDMAPFREVADLLYGGPWVAERLAAIEPFLGKNPDALHPVTRRIIEGGRRYSAVDAWRAFDRLTVLKRRIEPVWETIDALVVPTAVPAFRIAEVAADPIGTNAALGAYTNFVNLLDLSAIALPAGFGTDGMPFGIVLVAPAWHEDRLCRIGARYCRSTGLPLGATGHPLPPADGDEIPKGRESPGIPVAVFGLHLSGQPLNGELVALGGRLVRSCRTAPEYRMYVVGEAPKLKPGLIRVTDGSGAAIDLEVWELAPAAFGAFVEKIPPPLGIGTILLDDGAAIKGFICEPYAIHGAPDITAHGGWRAWRAASGR